MDKLQELHAKSTARHIREIAEQLVLEMAAIEREHDDLLVNLPATRAANTIEDNVKYAMKRMNTILIDMLPDLRWRTEPQPHVARDGNVTFDTL